MPARTIEAQALALARQLDAALAAGPDDALHDALVFGVGDLCGRLSAHGFTHDLAREIAEYEASQVRMFGAWIAHSSREAAARNWAEAAQEVLKPFAMKEAQMLADEILLLASLLQTGQATEAEQRNASIVAQKIAVKVRRVERLADELVAEAMEQARLPVFVPPVADVIQFPRRASPLLVGDVCP